MTDMGLDPQNFTNDEFNRAYEVVKEEHMAMCFLYGADRGRYGELMRGFENSYTEGHDRYPKTLTDTYNIMVKYKADPKYTQQLLDDGETGVAYIQYGSEDEDEEE